MFDFLLTNRGETWMSDSISFTIVTLERILRKIQNHEPLGQGKFDIFRIQIVFTGKAEKNQFWADRPAKKIGENVLK